MSFWEAILLGVVQGITEFLPISSTAHLVLTQYLLGIQFPGLSLEILFHIASVLAVTLYFRHDLVRLVQGFLRFLIRKTPGDRPAFWFCLYIVVATLLTGVLGVLLNKWLGDSLKSPYVVAGALFVTGSFLLFLERFHGYGKRQESNMKFLDSIVVGLAQTLAVLPGISRSGSTLVAALLMGLERETAVRFSFLLAIPVILGSSVLMIPELQAGTFAQLGWGPLAAGFITTFLFSWLGIVWLIGFLKKSRLIYFAIYCWVLAVFVVWYFDPTMHFDLPH